MKKNWLCRRFLAAALAVTLGAACNRQPQSAPASEEVPLSAPSTIKSGEVRPEAEVVAGADSVKVALQVHKTTVKHGEPLWMRVVITNTGTRPLMVPFDDFEYLPGLFTNSFGLKLDFRSVTGENLSGSVGSPMDSHPPLNCMNSNERASLDRQLGLGGRSTAKGGAPPTSSTAASKDFVVWLEPGEFVATPPWAYQPATEKYCRRIPPPKPVGLYAELPASRFLPTGTYTLGGSCEKHVGSPGGESQLVVFSIPKIEIQVLP